MIINRKKLSMVNNKTCVLICFIVSKLIVKHQEKHHLTCSNLHIKELDYASNVGLNMFEVHLSSVFIVNFEQIQPNLLLITLNRLADVVLVPVFLVSIEQIQNIDFVFLQ